VLQSPTAEQSHLRSAQAALKCLQAWWLGSSEFNREVAGKSLHPDFEALVCTCQLLQTKSFGDRAVEDLASNRTLEEHVKRVSEQLSCDALLKLSLITYHYKDKGFSGPISPGLLLFFAGPEEEFHVVCENVYSRYSLGDSQSSLAGFVHELEELLGFIEFQLIRGGWRLADQV